MADKLLKAVGKFKRKLNLEPRVGYLGGNDGTGEVHDRQNRNRYLVVFPQADGSFSSPVSIPIAPNVNLPAVAGTAVDVGFDANDRSVILGVNLVALSSTDANALQLNPLDKQASDFVSAGQLSPLYATRHADSDNFPLTAVVFPGLFFSGATLTLFEGGSIDLSGHQPASGEHCYVAAVLKADGTLDSFASTAVDANDPLSFDDITEALGAAAADDTPLKAWQLSGDDALLTVDEALVVDLRVPLASPSSGGGGADDTARYLAWRG